MTVSHGASRSADSADLQECLPWSVSAVSPDLPSWGLAVASNLAWWRTTLRTTIFYASGAASPLAPTL